MLNKVVMLGRLTKTPELRFTNSNNIPVTSFSIAVDRNFKRDGEDKPETDFFDVVCWQARAEFVCKHFTQGQPIAVEGRLQQRKWTDQQGVTRYAVEIIAESVHFAGFKRDDAQNGGYTNDAEAFDPFAEAA
jgi:single-strand DNA-binding protein